MPLDDNDKAEIAEMIRANQPAPARPSAPAPGPGPGRRPSADDWDSAPPAQQQAWVRHEVEAHLAALDRDAELMELRQFKKETEEAARAGRKPPKQERPTEGPPRLMTKLQEVIWGSNPK